MALHNPPPTSPAATAVMKGNRGRDTEPEKRIRSLLHRAGFRYRKDHPVVTGARRVRPDLVFTRRRVAVFVDGCFWHVCPEHGTKPKSNVGYWNTKLSDNVERDLAINTELARAGWTVVRIWEHMSPEEAARRIARVLRETKSSE